MPARFHQDASEGAHSVLAWRNLLAEWVLWLGAVGGGRCLQIRSLRVMMYSAICKLLWESWFAVSESV